MNPSELVRRAVLCAGLALALAVGAEPPHHTAPTATDSHDADSHDHTRHAAPAAAHDHHDGGLRTPIPPLTDADRAAAFPSLQHQHRHGASRHSFWLLDRLEAVDAAEGGNFGWDGLAWVGSDLNRVWLRSEGHARAGEVEDGRVEVLYGRPVLRWWDLLAGIRHDVGTGPSRSWAAFGVQGLAPYFFEIDATVYVSTAGQTALRVAAEYELLLTNRLILTWEAEAEWFGSADRARDIGAGLATVDLGLRLRYEFSRRFAPYVGFERTSNHGRTADLRGAPRDDLRGLLGVRMWF